jgi:cyclic pyranopterin monophosphate synthase
MTEFTHIDENGQVRMVDVSEKKETQRLAVACGTITMSPGTLEKIQNQDVKKGNVLETARIAGIMAAKKTSALIPMCHPLNITHAAVNFSPDPENNAIEIRAEVSSFGRTGVEIEALTVVAVAGITIYDMCKSYDRSMIIADVRLVEKSGGKSGRFHAES